MSGIKWTIEEDESLRRLYPNMSSLEVSQLMNRSLKSVYSRANILGVCKSEEFINSINSGRFKGGNKGKMFQFKKGNQAWNKGLKGLQIGGVETRFSKGSQPHNTRHDGAISIRVEDGRPYQYIRISKGVWKPLHNHIWINTHGNIPKGMIVVFKDKNPLNCVLENLELITRKENMARNTIQRYPRELKFTLKLLKKLKRTVDEKQN